MMPWRLALCAALFVSLAVPLPAARAADDEFELLETITVPAQQPDPGVKSKTSLDPKQTYKLVVSWVSG